MAVIKIEPYRGLYDDEIISNILTIQRDEFQIPISKEDQPDICAIKDFYQKGKGTFLIAFHDEKVVGTLGLLDIGNNQGALRKMFVNKDFRGKKHNTANLLLQEMIKWSFSQEIYSLFLGTTTVFLAAHKFYEKNGFEKISVSELPTAFPRMKVDEVFYKADLVQLGLSPVGTGKPQ